MNKISVIFGIVAISLLWVFPTQAAGQKAFVRDICVDSPDPYKEIVTVHKNQGFIAAQSKYQQIMLDPDSNCYRVPGNAGIPIIVFEKLQEDTLKGGGGMPVCVAIYHVKVEGQTDPDKKYYAVNFTPGTCDKNKI